MLLFIQWSLISIWWLRLYSSEFTQAPAFHLLVFCSCMLELTHLHSPLPPKHPKRIKRLWTFVSVKGHKSLLSGSKWKESACQNPSLFPNDGSHSQFDRRDKVFIPHFWPLPLFVLSFVLLKQIRSLRSAFYDIPETDFQKLNFRIKIRWNWGKRFTILNGKSYFLIFTVLIIHVYLFVCLFMYSFTLFVFSTFQNRKGVDPAIHISYYKYHF